MHYACRWRFGLVLVSINEVILSTGPRLGPGCVTVSAGSTPGTGKSTQYITSQPGQLSLAIPPWVSAMSTSYGYRATDREENGEFCVTAIAPCDQDCWHTDSVIFVLIYFLVLVLVLVLLVIINNQGISNLLTKMC